MKKQGCLILDPAHGIDVQGKQSPDGRLKEWQWSRERITSIYSSLLQMKLGFDVYSPFLTFQVEPGLATRVDYYNDLALKYDLCIMLSLHVDAYDPDQKTKETEWWNGTGFTFFTSRGDTRADTLAGMLGLTFAAKLPNERMRFDYGLSKDEQVSDLDREANFTILYGYWHRGKFTKANYHGVLIENCFMNSRIDIKKLQDPGWNRNLEDVYIIAILQMFHKFNLANILDEV